MPSIDNMDTMFYFDILIYKKGDEERETAKEYDAMGV